MRGDASDAMKTPTWLEAGYWQCSEEEAVKRIQLLEVLLSTGALCYQIKAALSSLQGEKVKLMCKEIYHLFETTTNGEDAAAACENIAKLNAYVTSALQDTGRRDLLTDVQDDAASLLAADEAKAIKIMENLAQPANYEARCEFVQAIHEDVGAIIECLS